MIKKNVFKVISLILIIFSLSFLIFTITNFTPKIHRLNSKIETLTSQISEVNNQNNILRNNLENENLDEYIEQKAREQGYSNENEIIFYDIS